MPYFHQFPFSNNSNNDFRGCGDSTPNVVKGGVRVVADSIRISSPTPSNARKAFYDVSIHLSVVLAMDKTFHLYHLDKGPSASCRPVE